MNKDYSKIDWIDVTFLILICSIVGSMLAILFVAAPMSYRAERICADNGYRLSSSYLDGAVYCEKKNEFGAIDIIKVK